MKRRCIIRGYQWLGSVLLVLLLAACGGPGDGNKGANTPGPTNAPTPTPTAGIQLGKQDCPAAVKDPAYWNPIVGVQAGVSSVESVTCANLIGNNSMQALVMVRSQGDSRMLDVYVYSKITDPAPQKIFSLQKLYNGDAKVSGYNTVLTGEVDQASSVNKGQSKATFKQDLYREFKWAEGAGTLVPIAFPGLFPELTRFEGERDQGLVNQGQDAWKLDPKQVATRLVQKLLNWTNTADPTVKSGGGKTDGEAVVEVKKNGPIVNTVTITMNRMEGNTNGGIWVAIKVEAGNMKISAPQQLDRLTSPQNVAGSGPAFEAVIGRVVVLDHVYSEIGRADIKGVQPGMGNANFTVKVPYTPSFRTGTQEGILALYTNSNADGSIAGAVLLKELIS